MAYFPPMLYLSQDGVPMMTSQTRTGSPDTEICKLIKMIYIHLI